MRRSFSARLPSTNSWRFTAGRVFDQTIEARAIFLRAQIHHGAAPARHRGRQFGPALRCSRLTRAVAGLAVRISRLRQEKLSIQPAPHPLVVGGDRRE